jgi:hypothetical protein
MQKNAQDWETLLFPKLSRAYVVPQLKSYWGGSHRKIEEDVYEGEGVEPQRRLLNELQGNDSGEEEKDAEAGKSHVAIDEPHTLHGAWSNIEVRVTHAVTAERSDGVVA